LKKYFWPVTAFITGILPGFFLVFNFIFSDVISLYERILSLLVVVVAYLVLGAAFGLASRDIRLAGGIWLSLPALFLAFIYSFKEVNSAAINLLYSAAALGSSVIGFHLGAKLSRRLKQ